MNFAKRFRTKNIFNLKKTNNVIITPIDHGLYEGSNNGLSDPRSTIKDLTEHSDAFLLAPGYLEEVMDLINPNTKIILRVGKRCKYKDSISKETIICSVERALYLGADAIAYTVHTGQMYEQECLATLVENANKYSLPVLAEIMPFNNTFNEVDIINLGRVSFEIGVDIIKTLYLSSGDSLDQLIKLCPIPIVIAGGSCDNNYIEVLKLINDSINKGCKGTAFGRKVWQCDNPKKMLNAMQIVVHERNLDKAISLFKE